MERPILRMQGFAYSLLVEDLHLRQLTPRELQLSNPAAILPFHPLVVGAYQRDLQWTANGREGSSCNPLGGNADAALL